MEGNVEGEMEDHKKVELISDKNHKLTRFDK